MPTDEELLSLLQEAGWEPDGTGRHVRGNYYVALLPRGLVHIGQRSPTASLVPGTNEWGQARPLAQAMDWVREKSREPI